MKNYMAYQMSKAIKERTGLTEKEYQMLLVEEMLKTFEVVAFSDQHLQMLLQSKSINKWFLRQLHKVNTEFLIAIRPFKGLTKRDV